MKNFSSYTLFSDYFGQDVKVLLADATEPDQRGILTVECAVMFQTRSNGQLKFEAIHRLMDVICGQNDLISQSTALLALGEAEVADQRQK